MNRNSLTDTEKIKMYKKLKKKELIELLIEAQKVDVSHDGTIKWTTDTTGTYLNDLKGDNVHITSNGITRIHRK